MSIVVSVRFMEEDEDVNECDDELSEPMLINVPAVIDSCDEEALAAEDEMSFACSVIQAGRYASIVMYTQ